MEKSRNVLWSVLYIWLLNVAFPLTFIYPTLAEVWVIITKALPGAVRVFTLAAFVSRAWEAHLLFGTSADWVELYSSWIISACVWFVACSLSLLAWSPVFDRGEVRRTDRRYRFEKRCRSWAWNHRKLWRRRAVADHCWVPLVNWAGVPEETVVHIVVAIGPKILRRQLTELFAIYGPSPEIGEYSVVNQCHATRTAPDGLKNQSIASPWAYLGQDAQGIVNTSVSVNAASLGMSEAQIAFKKDLAGTIRLDHQFTEAQKLQIKDAVDFPIYFGGGGPITSDHVVLAALRKVVRQVHASIARIEKTPVPTLIVGSTDRESRLYPEDHVSHYFYTGENKDYTRTILPFLSRLAKAIRAKTHKNRKASASPFVKPSAVAYRRILQIIEALQSLGDLPERIYVALSDIPAGFERLVFEDIYEFSPADYRDIFLRTGANGGVGYGIYPDELMFPDAPPNREYAYSYDEVTGRSTMMFRGYSNGYSHAHDKWAAFLKNPVMSFPEFKLVFEITSRVGPYLTYSITKVDNGSADPVVRRLEIEEKNKFVRILDVASSINGLGMLVRKNYLSVNKMEWDTMVNWCLSLDEKSLNFQNVMTHLRRMAPGVSLVNKELTKPWHLPKHHYRTFALAALIYTRKIAKDNGRIEALANNSSQAFLKILKHGLLAPVTALNIIAGTLIHSTIADHIVIYPDNFVETRKYIPVTHIASPGSFTYKTMIGLEGELAGEFCEFCGEVDGHLGDQVIQCEDCGRSGAVEIEMTNEDIEQVRNELQDDDRDPQGLRDIKKQAKEALPAAFVRTVKFRYLCGGPGTGKSYIIRLLVDDNYAVYVPFMKLKTDYTKEKMNGLDVKFATVHRGLSLPGVKALCVDEFTALDFRYMKMVIAKTGAELVYIVGDTEQTRVREPEEGEYIGNHVDIDKLPKHTLTRNFRNPQDAVRLVNHVYGYNMRAMSGVEESIRVIRKDDYTPAEGASTDMFFTHVTAATRGRTAQDADKYTVRSFQGSTLDHAVLFVTAADEATASAHGMSVVALTRHTKSLTIVIDGSQFSHQWLEMHKLSLDGLDLGLVAALPEHDASDFPKTDPVVEEGDDIKEFYANAEEFEPIKVLRQDWILLSRTRLAILCFGGPMFAFSSYFASTLVGNLMSLVLVFCAFRISFGRVLLQPVSSLTTVLRFGYKHYLCSWLVVWLVLKSPRVFTEAVLSPHAPQPLIGLLFDLALPGWLLDALSFGFSHVIGLLEGFVVVSNTLKLQPGLGFFAFVASIIAHLRDALQFPDMVLLAMGRRSVVAIACAIGWYRSRYHIPSFVLYTRGSMDLIVGRSFLAHFSVPDLKIGIQIWDYDFIAPEGIRVAINGPIDFSIRYTETAGKFFAKQRQKLFSMRKEADPEKGDLTEKYPVPRDSFRQSFEGLVTDMWTDIGTGLNAVGSSILPDSWKSGKIQLEDYVSPTNSRGNLKRQPGYVRKFTRGLGHTFSGSSLAQLVNVMGTRYLSRKAGPSKPFGAEAELLAEKMVNEFCKEHMSEVEGFDEDLFDTVMEEADAAAKAKGYDKQLQGEDDSNFRRVMMHLKDIFKPSPKKTFDETKAGQGISAWNKSAQVVFGTCIRYFNAAFQKRLLPHVVFDNRLTSEQVMAMLKKAAERVPHGAKNGVTDFTMFDAQQTEFTQAIEKAMLRRLGASDLLIELYYSLRKNYSITGGPVQGTAGTEKTSGEPGTLLFNSIVNVVLMNYLLRGEGPVALAMKGDDGYKRQANLTLNLTRMKEYEQFCRMTIKISYEDPAEFCGCVIGQGSMAPNLYRRLISIQGKSFKDYKAFADYQVSLRDWLKTIIRSDPNEVVALNAATFNETNPEETLPAIQGVLEDLISFSHLGEEDFLANTTLVRPQGLHITSDPNGRIHYDGADAHTLSFEEIEMGRLQFRPASESEEGIELTTRAFL